MTWVIGSPTPFGYSVLISDVQVTFEFPNKKKDYYDILQKIYPIGNYAMAGFSGDVENGFIFLSDLRMFMNTPNEGQEWQPDKLAREWGKKAKDMYAKLTVNKRTKLSIIIAAIDPFQNNGHENEPKVLVAKLNSPNFTYTASRSWKPLSIGSGNDKKEYVDAIKKINEDPATLMQMEVGNPYGYGSILGVVLSYDVFRNPYPGVSRNLQMACITKKGFQIAPLNFNADIGEPHEQKIEMPDIAKSWKEYKEKVDQIYGKGFNRAKAIA